MNMTVVKRIESCERMIAKKAVPEMILISYDDVKHKWRIQEHYMRKNSKGAIIRGGHVKTLYMSHYRGYIVSSEFHGRITLDLLSCSNDDSGNLHTLNIDEVRNSVNAENGRGLSFDYVESNDNNECMFIVTVIEYK